MPITKKDILKEMARRELARRELARRQQAEAYRDPYVGARVPSPSELLINDAAPRMVSDRTTKDPVSGIDYEPRPEFAEMRQYSPSGEGLPSLQLAPEGTRIQNTNSPYWNLPDGQRKMFDKLWQRGGSTPENRQYLKANFGVDPVEQPPYLLHGTTAGATARFAEGLFSRGGNLPQSVNSNQAVEQIASMIGALLPTTMLGGVASPLGAPIAGAIAGGGGTTGIIDPNDPDLVGQVLVGLLAGGYGGILAAGKPRPLTPPALLGATERMAPPFIGIQPRAIDMIPQEQVAARMAAAKAPPQLPYRPDTPNLGVLVDKPKAKLVPNQSMTPEQWREWINQEEANAPKVTRYVKKEGGYRPVGQSTPEQVRMGDVRNVPPVASVQGAVQKPSPVKAVEQPKPVSAKVPIIADKPTSPTGATSTIQTNKLAVGNETDFVGKSLQPPSTPPTVKQPWEMSKAEAVAVEVPKGGKPQSRAAGFDPQLLGEMAEKATPTFLKSAEARVKLPESKQLFDEIRQADEVRGVTEGRWLESLRTLGLKKLNNKQAVDLGKQMNEGTGGQQYAAVLQEVWQTAKDAGIEIGKVKNYFPRIIKREIAEKMYDDLRPVIAELKKGEIPDEAVANALAKKDVQTRDVIQHMIDSGQAKGYRDAVEGLYYAAQHDLFKVTSFEKHRSLKTELPSWVYETDARQVLPMYIEAMSKRIADAKTWGPNLERAGETITKIRNSDMAEVGTVEQVLKTHTGLLQQERALGTKARKFVDRATAGLYGAKVGLGTSTIPNITQTLISTASTYGYPKTLKAIFKLVVNPEARTNARRSGAVNHDMMQAMTGYHPAGVWGKFADFTTKYSGFKLVNKFNQYVAAETGRVAVTDYHAAAQKGGRYGEWAKQRLNDLGIDHTKPLTEDILAKTMYRVATDTQLQSNILKDPLWMNDPRWKWAAVLKRFGYKQAKYQKDLITREIQRGNAMPLLRLAAGGYVGGEFVVWARNKLKSALTGEPVYREDEHLTWQRFINNIVAVGSLGVFTDITGGITAPKEATETWKKVTFAVTPALVGEAWRVGDVGLKIAKDYDAYGGEVAARRNLPDVMERVSPLVGQVGERLADDGSKKNRDKSFKGKKRTEILDDFIDGNKEEAVRKFKLWNENHPNNPLKPADVGGDEQRKRKKQKYLVKAGVK